MSNDAISPKESISGNLPDRLERREATSCDIELLADLNALLIHDEGHRNRMNQQQLAERMRGWLNDDYRAVLFDVDGTPAAYVLFRERAEQIYLRQFFVVPHFRRRGIGRQVIESLRANVWAGGKRLIVEALIANPTAVAFWRAVGFSDYSLKLEVLPPDNTPMDSSND